MTAQRFTSRTATSPWLFRLASRVPSGENLRTLTNPELVIWRTRLVVPACQILIRP